MNNTEKEANSDNVPALQHRTRNPDAERTLRIGISTCLLGENVRFDGGHKKDPFLTQTLSPFVEWVPVCPEVEMGMSIPREAIRLVGQPDNPRLVTTRTGIDHSEGMRRFTEKRLRELEAMNLSGYVLKKDSPSCGMERVRVYNEGGAVRTGVGVFARGLMNHFPLLPVEEEGRLYDPALRDNFIERAFCYWRWQNLERGRVSRGALVAFHAAHKYLLMAHSPKHYTELGRWVAAAKDRSSALLRSRYGELLMEALKVKATRRKHVNVLQHMLGFFKEHLSAVEKQEMLGLLEDYRREWTPLIVPITMIRHYVAKYNVQYLADQVYLNPHPRELMLRNHV